MLLRIENGAPLSLNGKRDGNIGRRQQIRHVLRPLKHHKVLWISEHFFKPERSKLCSLCQAIRVHVYQPLKGTSGQQVDFLKYEGRACDRVQDSERCCSTLYEGGFPGTELPRKCDESRPLLWVKLCDEGRGFVRKVIKRGESPLHRLIVPSEMLLCFRMVDRFDVAAEEEKLKGLREQEEEDLAQVLSSRYGLSYTDLGVVPIDMEALRLIPEKQAREAEAAAFAKAAKKLSVALRNPQNPALAPVLADLESRGFVLEKFLVSHKSLERAYARYPDLSLAGESKAGVFDITSEEYETLAKEITSLAALKSFLDTALASKKTAHVSRLLEQVVAAALFLKASDVHFEPEEAGVRLRLRFDGLLTDAYSFKFTQYHAISSRIKLLSGLKLNVTDRAQDGRFTIATKEIEIEVRTSVIPGAYGESIVMRLLDPRTIRRSLEEMGMHPKLLERVRKEIHRPNGMLLTTGPTGSGKTTSLYTFMQELHTPDVKIVTIEDPIEYHVQGIVQTQTDKGYTFASGLRSVLRQDPDVIMVGEIRDAEVAETAIQAALTGHFVFSTLHTNNAAGAFPRLVDLKVDPKLFASAVTVAMAQRLVRTLDPETRKARPATEDEQKIMRAAFDTLEDTSLIPASFDTVYDAVPTEAGDTGYRGRISVFEAIFMDDQLGDFLRDNPSEGDIAKHVLRQGYPTMLQDGILKVLAGVTTLEELSRVVELPT